MGQTLDDAKQILKRYNQEHLLNNYEKLTDENKRRIIEQIFTIDFEQINNLYEEAKSITAKKEDVIEPIKYIEKSKLTDEEIGSYKKIGVEEIKQGKLAALTMAGGQRHKASDIVDRKAHLC